MMTGKRGIAVLFCAISLVFAKPGLAVNPFSFLPFFSDSVDWDFNGDGMIRVSLVSVPHLSGGLLAKDIGSDLERMIKSATKKPVRVAVEPVESAKSLMGWWYAPKSAEAKNRVFTSSTDFLIVTEDDTIVLNYPEFFFEGVRCLSDEAKKLQIRTALLLTAKPGTTFRDKRVGSVAEIVYRVGDGCGIEVIPAAYGWIQTMQRNRMRGNSPVKARASSFLAAAGIWSAIAGTAAEGIALEVDWTTKDLTRDLARSALEAVEIEREKSHYKGPFEGTVRIDPRIRKRLKIFLPNTAEDDPLRQSFSCILDAAHLDSFWRTPADWYRDGFDRYSTCFDLVFGDVAQVDQYLNTSLYTSFPSVPKGIPDPVVAVYPRIPLGTNETVLTLQNLEAFLFNGYDSAKANGIALVPYPLAWARAHQQNPALTKPEQDGKSNDWLNYLLASMFYTCVSGRYQPPSDREKPHFANQNHPHGFFEQCARIGYDTMIQLSSLRTARNTLILRSDTYRVAKDKPGFASIRLLDKPAAEVHVLCATDQPGLANLSRDELVFTPENFDIEQTVRIDPATNTPTLFTSFMASAQSTDPLINGRSDARPLVLNYDEHQTGKLSFDRDEVSPTTGFTVRLRADVSPTDMVRTDIRQNAMLEQERYLVPEFPDGVSFQLHPTADDYRNGFIKITVRLSSNDLRFHGQAVEKTFRLSSDGMKLPTVRLTEPLLAKPIQGPAFVTARAESDTQSGVRRLSLFLGQKGLASANSTVCTAAVENGPPMTRLPSGVYSLWAEVESTNGTVVATQPYTLQVE
ncbi:MAG: hypothetical protein IJR99_12600 [Kiritimatiellae bacterium]|nr:hypothetical protein [Kiritimatiellia bacterium]